MNISSCYKIGYVLKPHGLKGEVTIAVDFEHQDSLEAVDSVFIEKNKTLVPYFIESLSNRGDKAFVKFEDVDTPEAAESLKGCSLYLPKESRQQSGKGEFYDDEVVGFEIEDEKEGVLGKVSSVVQSGLSRLLSVDYNGREVLIPIIGPFIKSVNKSKKKILVSLPEGFLDI